MTRSGDLKTGRIWGFLGFLFWPWMVFMAVPGMLGVVGLRLCGRLRSWGPWYRVLWRWWLLTLLAPLGLLQLAWKTRRWKLVAAVALLFPFMLGSLGSLLVAEPSWRPEQGITTAEPPSWRHPFGTNGDGVDLSILIILGCRNSYLAATVALAVILLAGIPLGILLERPHGRRLLRAAISALESLPLLFGMMILASFASLWIGRLGEQGWLAAGWHSTLRAAVIGAGIGLWLLSPMATLVSEKIAYFRRQDFIDASLTNGIPLARVVWYHILYRNALPEISILASHLAGLSVLFETSLGYLFSIGTAKLGGGFYYTLAQLLTTQEAKQAVLFLDQWWLFTFPMLFIMTAILGFLLAGDGVSDLFREPIEAVDGDRLIPASERLTPGRTAAASNP